MADDVKPTGTVGGPNPNTGSSDAARGLGGHSKDADHSPGTPAEYVKQGEAEEPEAATNADLSHSGTEGSLGIKPL